MILPPMILPLDGSLQQRAPIQTSGAPERILTDGEVLPLAQVKLCATFGERRGNGFRRHSAASVLPCSLRPPRVHLVARGLPMRIGGLASLPLRVSLPCRGIAGTRPSAHHLSLCRDVHRLDRGVAGRLERTRQRLGNAIPVNGPTAESASLREHLAKHVQNEFGRYGVMPLASAL